MRGKEEMFRLKEKWVAEGQYPTKYFFNFENATLKNKNKNQ